MKRLYDWFWELMDEQGHDWRGQRVMAGLFGYAVLVIGLLLMWLMTLIHDFGNKLPDIGKNTFFINFMPLPGIKKGLEIFPAPFGFSPLSLFQHHFPREQGLAYAHLQRVETGSQRFHAERFGQITTMQWQAAANN